MSQTDQLGYKKTILCLCEHESTHSHCKKLESCRINVALPCTFINAKKLHNWQCPSILTDLPKMSVDQNSFKSENVWDPVSILTFFLIYLTHIAMPSRTQGGLVRLTCLNYWIDCHKMLYKYLWSPEDESFDFSKSGTFPLVPPAGQSCFFIQWNISKLSRWHKIL